MEHSVVHMLLYIILKHNPQTQYTFTDEVDALLVAEFHFFHEFTQDNRHEHMLLRLVELLFYV
jgi:hypothetical protein